MRLCAKGGVHLILFTSPKMWKGFAECTHVCLQFEHDLSKISLDYGEKGCLQVKLILVGSQRYWTDI